MESSLNVPLADILRIHSEAIRSSGVMNQVAPGVDVVFTTQYLVYIPTANNPINNPNNLLGEGPRNTEPQFIEALPRISLSKRALKGLKTLTCTICLDEKRLGEPISSLPCDHHFCLNCIAQWLCNQSRCPICHLQLPRENETFIPQLDLLRQSPFKFDANELRVRSVINLQSLVLLIDPKYKVDNVPNNRGSLLRIIEQSEFTEITEYQLVYTPEDLENLPRAFLRNLLIQADRGALDRGLNRGTARRFSRKRLRSMLLGSSCSQSETSSSASREVGSQADL